MTSPEQDESGQGNSSGGKGAKQLILGILLVMGALFVVGLFEKVVGWKKQREMMVSALVSNVRVMEAVPESKEEVLTLPGYLVGYNVTPILARTNGYLKNFYVDIGEEVKVNQLLCEIDTPDVDAEWVQAKADLESAIAKRDIAKITADRWKGLYEHDQESISKQEVDQTTAEFDSAIAIVSAAKANVERLEVLKNFKFIYAPFDGIVVERNIDIGSLISVGNESMTQPYTTGFETLLQPLFKIANLNTLRVFVDVPQPYYPQIEDGVQAQIVVPEHPDRIFRGVVDRNAVALDQSSRTLLTQVNIDNKDNILRPGLYAQVTFSFPPYKDSFNIPIGAVIIRDGPPFLAIVKEDNTVVLKEVEIGRDYGKSVQIVKGLNKGDRVILRPNYRIKDGSQVHILPSEDIQNNHE